eukprot:6411-Heterococcus_DN1.PRE.9
MFAPVNVDPETNVEQTTRALSSPAFAVLTTTLALVNVNPKTNVEQTTRGLSLPTFAVLTKGRFWFSKIWPGARNDSMAQWSQSAPDSMLLLLQNTLAALCFFIHL